MYIIPESSYAFTYEKTPSFFISYEYCWGSPKTKLFDESFDISRFDDQTEEFETLKAICRYCTGKNTVEEIIFASQKDLSMINRCVKHYDNYLKMIIH